jgi:hypothetical protein
MANREVDFTLLEPFVLSERRSQRIDDAEGERITADAGEVFAEQVGASTEVARGRGADYFDVMAFPGHLAATDRARGCFGDRVEIGDGETEGRIGLDGETERHHRVGLVDGLLSLAVEGGGLGGGGDHPTVILDRGPGEGRLVPAASRLL